MAIEEANREGGIHGVEIVLKIEDSRTDEVQAVTALSKLASVEGIQFIIGPTWEASASAVVPQAREQEILLISPSSYLSIKKEGSPRLFSTYPPYEHEVEGLISLFAEKQWSSFAIIYNNEFYSETMQSIFTKASEERGWTTQSFSQETGNRDYRTILLKIKQTKNVDAIYAPLSDNMDEGQLMRQMKEMNLDVPVIGTGSTENNLLLETHGEAIEGIIYTYPEQGPQYVKFEERFVRRYGHPPGSPSAVSAYDATQLLIAGMRSGATTPKEMSQYLHNGTHEGASGNISFDANGIIEKTTYALKTVRNGSFVAYRQKR